MPFAKRWGLFFEASLQHQRRKLIQIMGGGTKQNYSITTTLLYILFLHYIRLHKLCVLTTQCRVNKFTAQNSNKIYYIILYRLYLAYLNDFFSWYSTLKIGFAVEYIYIYCDNKFRYIIVMYSCKNIYYIYLFVQA